MKEKNKIRKEIKQKIKFFITNADEYLCSSLLSFYYRLNLPTLLLSFIAFELLLKGGLVYIYKEEAEDYIDKKLRKYSHDLVKIYKILYRKFPILKDNDIEILLGNYCEKIIFKGDIINQSSIYERARYSAGVILISQFENEVLNPYLSLRRKISSLLRNEIGDLPLLKQYEKIIKKFHRSFKKNQLGKVK